jgi:outer membrane receptor for ferrienterochelin and colicins
VAKKNITVELGKSQEINFVLEEEHMTINQVVVTGTKTFKRQTESPVIVNVLESKALEMVQACNISEGLRFQPGLRVETDCQTCNYTQLRMNGLGGSYSQILINGRPIFSPLTGLYGMEQIPANMVERIEVVRGGGSALYGSSAIGGTVNIITRIPNESSYDFSALTQSTNGAGMDNVLKRQPYYADQQTHCRGCHFCEPPPPGSLRPQRRQLFGITVACATTRSAPTCFSPQLIIRSSKSISAA